MYLCNIFLQCEEEDDGLNSNGALRGGADGSHANKRAHHNALERKRRDHIKDSFTSLRDCVPALQGEKVEHYPQTRPHFGN